MDVQLWSYNYDPEPTGIAPLSRACARALVDRGHRVYVVAAHPHYPEPRWGTRLLPYREVRDGITVVRLPLWPGRAGVLERVRQEATFSAALSLAAPVLPRPDIILAVSPSFPALLPAMVSARARGLPWVLWLQDILPDAATATDLMREGLLVGTARWLERRAYRSAHRIAVISDSFADNLRAKGVPDAKLVRIFNPASLPIRSEPRLEDEIDPGLVLNMGNIGKTQNLVHVTRAFEASEELARLGARFVMAGDGTAGREVRAAIRTDRVEVTGILDPEELGALLTRAAVGLVSQEYEGVDFNVPSKLMNFMGQGLPVVAAVRPDSEVAKIVERSGAGWVTSGSDARELAAVIARALVDPEESRRRGERGWEFAREHFHPRVVAERFETVLEEAVGASRRLPCQC